MGGHPHSHQCASSQSSEICFLTQDTASGSCWWMRIHKAPQLCLQGSYLLSNCHFWESETEINLSAERCSTMQMWCSLCSWCWFGMWNHHPHWVTRFCPGLSSQIVLGDVRTSSFCMDRAGLLIAELRVSLALSTANSGVATLVCLVNWFAPVSASQETIVPLILRKTSTAPVGKGNEVDAVKTGIPLEQRRSRMSHLTGIFVLFPRDSASRFLEVIEAYGWLWYVLVQ